MMMFIFGMATSFALMFLSTAIYALCTIAKRADQQAEKIKLGNGKGSYITKSDGPTN